MMHEASEPTPSFAMPTTVGFGISARRWRGVLALWTLVVEVAGSILGLEVVCVCVSVTALLLRVVPPPLHLTLLIPARRLGS